MILNKKKKVILITGSSSGIGYGLAKKFHEEGNIVLLCSKNIKKLKTASKSLNNSFYVNADLTKKDQIKKALKKIKSKFKKIDILICNYGNSDFKKNNYDLKHAFENNFFSTVNTINFSIPLLRKSNSKIVCISSICGIESISGAPIGYSLAKSAVNNFIKLISKDLAQNNILINCIAPGNILFKGSTWEKKLKKNKLKVKRYIDENVPLKKFGSINEIFYLCNYLCSEQNFSTGSTFVLDGGQTKKFI